MEFNLLDDTPLNSGPKGGNRNYNDNKPFKSFNQDNKLEDDILVSSPEKHDNSNQINSLLLLK